MLCCDTCDLMPQECLKVLYFYWSTSMDIFLNVLYSGKGSSYFKNVLHTIKGKKGFSQLLTERFFGDPKKKSIEKALMLHTFRICQKFQNDPKVYSMKPNYIAGFYGRWKWALMKGSQILHFWILPLFYLRKLLDCLDFKKNNFSSYGISTLSHPRASNSDTFEILSKSNAHGTL